jgi:N-acetylglucosaminyldiphosphoundecaprenol N-acetyl-beta-D-mannosaminyltransferase
VSEIAILGVRLTAQRYEEAIERFLGAAVAGVRLRAHFCTVHSLVEAHDSEVLRDVFASAEMVAMDGRPLVWFARRGGALEAERVCGPDVMLSLCDRGRAVGLRHFFLGGQPGVPGRLASRLAGSYPGLEVVGTESPPFRQLSADEDAALVERINNASPHVVWIGLGSPKQEFWAADHATDLHAPLLLPVGAAFDFHSGRVRRAPERIQRAGLEWLFRIAVEPRRLWRRYLVTNTRFLYLLVKGSLAR